MLFCFLAPDVKIKTDHSDYVAFWKLFDWKLFAIQNPDASFLVENITLIPIVLCFQCALESFTTTIISFIWNVERLLRKNVYDALHFTKISMFNGVVVKRSFILFTLTTTRKNENDFESPSNRNYTEPACFMTWLLFLKMFVLCDLLYINKCL